MIKTWWRRPLTAQAGRVAGAAAVVILAAGTAQAAGGGGSGNPWLDLAWKAVNLAALVALIWFFGRKPIAAMFRSAAQQAREALAGERAEAQTAAQALAEQRQRIAGLEAELQRLAGEARAEARQEHDRLVADARAQAERIKTTVQMQVEQEFNKARKELQAELAGETVRLAEEMIRQRMDDEGRRRILTRAIDQLGARS